MMRLACIFLTLVLGLWSFSALASVPKLMKYQGFLVDKEGTPVDGEWVVTFSLYTSANAATPIYQETRTVYPEVGVFAVLLGSDAGNPLPTGKFEDGALFLGLTVNGAEEPVELTPRQQVVSNVYAFVAGKASTCDQATNSLSLGGVGAASYVTLSQIPELCVVPEDLPLLVEELAVTEEELPALLEALGYGQLDIAAVQAYLDDQGYVSGPHFTGDYQDLSTPPDLSVYLTAESLDGLATYADLGAYALSADLDAYATLESLDGYVTVEDAAGFVDAQQCIEVNKDSGLYLLADGSVVLAGDLDIGYNTLSNMAIDVCPVLDDVQDPPTGMLCFEPETGQLVVYDGDIWVAIGASAKSLNCEGCVDESHVSFKYAASDAKSGAALSAMDLTCVDCVDASNVSFAWAKGVLPGGDAEKAVLADLASDLWCGGCVQKAELAPGVLAAGNVSYDDGDTGMGALNVQEAIVKMHGELSGSEAAGEGRGNMFMQAREWNIAPYGKGKTYVHLFNPQVAPKMLAYLYADEVGTTLGGTKIVSAPFSPNAYSAVSGSANTNTLVAQTAYVFNVGSHLLVHQTTGANAGRWELNQVAGIEGSTLIMSKPLQYDYVSGAQAVVAASYGQLIVEAGGILKPIPYSNTTASGGILYVRAETIMVKAGGAIRGDAGGFPGGASSQGASGMQGSSECAAPGAYSSSANCSGGGGATASGGGGGGGNKTAGADGPSGGEGGGTKGDAQLGTMEMGSGGGSGLGPRAGGAGGGLVVLGATNILVEGGGALTAKGEEVAPESTICENQWDYKGFTLCGKSVGNIGTDSIPAGCTPFQPGAGWGQSDFVAICQHYQPLFGGAPSDCSNVDMDADGGLCTNFQAAACWEMNNSPDVWLRSPVFDWNPTNGGQNCNITNDSTNVLVYVCAGSPGGGGAGGSVVVFADQVVDNGAVDVSGGTSEAGDGGDGWYVKQAPIPGAINAMYPKGVQIMVDGKDITAAVGDPNSKGTPNWDGVAKLWGETGTKPWSTGMLDLSSAASWTLGEHALEFRETGGAGGNMKMFLYTVYPFSESSPPVNNTCAEVVTLAVSQPLQVSGTTEDVMGKLKASNDYSQPGCGGAAGPDVVYKFVLTDWSQLQFDVIAAFDPVVYIRKDNCATGSMVACGTKQLVTDVLKAGTYYLFIDSNLAQAKGDFNLVVTPLTPAPPAASTCAAPEVLDLAGGSGEASGLTLFATNDYSASCGGAEAPDLVFQFQVPPMTSAVTIDVLVDYNPVIYIQKDSCGSNAISCVPGGSYTMQWPVAGTYYLVLDGQSADDAGEFLLQVTLQ